MHALLVMAVALWVVGSDGSWALTPWPHASTVLQQRRGRLPIVLSAVGFGTGSIPAASIMSTSIDQWGA